MKEWNHQYSGTVPIVTGDRKYAQDFVRDFRAMQDRIGALISDLVDAIPILLNGGTVTQGGGLNLNITEGFGYAKHEVDIPDDWSISPPGIIQEDLMAIRVYWAAQTNINASSDNCSVFNTVDDGATINYVKMRYLEVDGNTRNRAKLTGNYSYEIVPEFDLQVDDNAPTNYDIELAQFTSSAGTYTFTSQASKGALSVENIEVDTIVEKTTDNGIDIETVHLEDGNISNIGTMNVDTMVEKTTNNGIDMESVHIEDGDISNVGTINVDTLTEKTTDNGIDIESVHIEDGVVSLSGIPIFGYLNDGTPLYSKVLTGAFGSADTFVDLAHGITNASTYSKILGLTVFVHDGTNNWSVPHNASSTTIPTYAFYNDTNVRILRGSTGTARNVMAFLIYR